MMRSDETRHDDGWDRKGREYQNADPEGATKNGKEQTNLLTDDSAGDQH
jgi:hypothetical protein